ncbi:hypothetical protein [Sediminibacter sp. Hel_I_10]|uniref:hypothetical protein n=1 Tax=Sediminibacter sp. Hel_I_10 TaxID=1392490 RepID=UPI00047CE4F7|nr:hypothetical protein [Sediminibacter sp. Hel_I_10]
MPQELITCNIRPHLVSFLYKELYADDHAVYEDKKVKLAKVVKSSVLGQLITVFKTKAKLANIEKVTGYSLFLKIIENQEASGEFHEKYQTSISVLQLLPEDVIVINNYLDSIYDTALVEFVKGYSKNSNPSKSLVHEGVDKFMVEHDLYETETDPMALIRRYYRAIQKNHSLHKIQNQTGNRAKYFNSL